LSIIIKHYFFFTKYLTNDPTGLKSFDPIETQPFTEMKIKIKKILM
tara:strand:+ start:232 stop:369 length:138 start_codon:yes stop_codon:yes gene_type:complete